MDSAEPVPRDKSPPDVKEGSSTEKGVEESSPIPTDSTKKKRKRRVKRNVLKDNVASETDSAPQSKESSVKNSIQTKKSLNKEEAAGCPAEGKVSDQENHSKDSGKSTKKGRNAKKKAAAGNSSSQNPGIEVPVLNALQPKVFPLYTPPRHFRNVPAGIQPMFYTRQSPIIQKQESPKQEKFLPYWTAQQVETGLKFGPLVSGIIRINPRNYQKAYITPADEDDSKDILIDGIIDRNRALEGDEVAVKLYDESRWQVDENFDGEPTLQKTGMVVYIIAMNHNRSTVGYLKLVNQAAKSTPTKSGIISQGAASPRNSSSNAQSPNVQPTTVTQSNQCSSSSSAESPKTSAKAKDVTYKMPDKVLFSPRDARMPRMWVQTSQLPPGSPVDLNPTNCMNHLFLASIHEWNAQPIANGKLLTYIGEADEVETETVALLLEQGLDVTPYPENLLTLPPLPFQIPEKELKERLDLRGSLIFTIDPETAKDLDDALSVKDLGDGLLEVGVHIADPSFFLEENSPLDNLVRERATSIYLVQNVFHMLPKELCLLCSLLPGEDKLAFSLIMTVDTRTWKVVSHEFARSIVNSSAQLSYEHAQAFIMDPGCINTRKDFPVVHNGYTVEDLCKAVNLLWPFSAALRERRFSNNGIMEVDEGEYAGGALKINQPKLCFKLDGETCMPREVFLYETKESNNLIEELMLLANILTAQRLASMFPKHAFLRRHSRPKMRMLNQLSLALMRYGIHLDTSAAGALNASLERYGVIEIEPTKSIERAIPENLSKKTICNTSPSARDSEVVEHDSTDSCEGVGTLSSENTVLEIQQDVIVNTCTSSSVTVTEIEENLRTLVVREDEIDPVVLKEESKISSGNECLPKTQCISDVPDSSVEKKIKDNGQKGDVSFTSSPSKVPSEEELSLARGLVLNHLCAKPMVRAEYYCYGAKLEESIKGISQSRADSEAEGVEVYTHHYALNVPLYTHFTSPIRRYADIMVHRLLAASLGYQSPPQLDPHSLQSIATNCNKQKYGAKRASEASNDLFFRLWVRLQAEKDGGEKMGKEPKTGDSDEQRSPGGLRETAVVVNAKDHSFDAILLRFGVVVRVYVNKLPATVKHLKKHGSSVISIHWFKPGEKAVSRDSPIQDITTFSIVRLEIYYSYTVRRIRAELLSPFTT